MILQRIREAERDMMFEEYRDRVGELITGIVQQSDSRYTLVQLRERVEALLPKSEQVDGERYDHSQRIKAVIKEVSPSTKGPSIIVSRRDPELIKKLFELEVPEIADGLVEIANVAREPGYRSKIAVVSHADGVDPVGACVGPRGSRVRMVVSELRGEKIDIIPYNDEPARFVAKALSPARVREVLVDDDGRQATVIVPDDQLSLAIGREGQNARLAARLTGWRIDIKSETEFATEEQDDGYEPEETSGRCAAILGNGRRCPNAVAARLALLRPRRPPGARGHRARTTSAARRRRSSRGRPGRRGDARRRHPQRGRRPARAGPRGGRARGARRRRAGAGRGAHLIGARGHIPARRCIGCGRVAPKADLRRLAVRDDAVVADPAAALPGRGAYVCGRRLPRAGGPPTCVRTRVPPFRVRPRRPRRIESLMAEKRVHEIAKERGMSASDALLKLRAAGIDVTAAASVVDEAEALRALGANGSATAAPPRPAAGQRAAQPGAPPGASPASAPAAARRARRAARPAAPPPRPASRSAPRAASSSPTARR